MKQMWSKEEIEKASKATLEDIVDTAGNKRFIEGALTTGTFTAIKFTYARWSLSGTHLMLVVNFDTTNATSVNIGAVLAEAELPSYILNKIVGNVLDWKYANIFDSSTQTDNIGVYLKKDNNVLKITSAQNKSLMMNNTARIQFDLLIDSE